MGLLDSIFGGGNSGFQKTGSASPLTLGLLALLAYKSFKPGGPLGNVFGGAPANDPGTPGGSPRMPTGAPGQPSGNVFGGNAGGVPGAGGGLPDIGGLLRGGLGSLLGGALGGAATGGLLNGGLGDLLRRFQQNGMGDTANSWVGHGPNRAVDPQGLEQALGRDTVEELSTHSGRPYNEVLSELSESLPNTVDKLTPEGRPPTDDEASRWV
jgi:uncharacterized protein YidB (DUF937 family)